MHEVFWGFFCFDSHPFPASLPRSLWCVCELSGKLTDCKQLEMLPLFSASTYQENPMNYRWKDVFKVSVSEWFFWVYFTSSYFAYLYIYLSICSLF